MYQNKEIMKNIYILPTDKPSRLSINCQTNLLQLGLENRMFHDDKNIYISSDEEIKVGDWYYLPRTNDVYKCNEDPTELNLERRFGVTKIIMSTDPELIKDGIQSIPDEFLEWFINNQSCEYVDLIGLRKEKGYEFLEYEIIIPKEEPKQETQGYICPQTKKQCDDECCVSASDCHLEASMGVLSEPKQETLEEVAEKIADNFEEPNFKAGVIYGFIEGAKLQQGKMYSEEDMIKAIKFGELYQKSGQKSLFEKKGKTPSQAIEHFIKSFNKK